MFFFLFVLFCRCLLLFLNFYSSCVFIFQCLPLSLSLFIYLFFTCYSSCFHNLLVLISLSYLSYLIYYYFINLPYFIFSLIIFFSIFFRISSHLPIFFPFFPIFFFLHMRISVLKIDTWTPNELRDVTDYNYIHPSHTFFKYNYQLLLLFFFNLLTLMHLVSGGK